MTTKDETIINYINKLLSFACELKDIGGKRFKKDSNPNKLFMLFALQEASNSFIIFRDVYIASLKEPEFFTQLSIMGRNIHEIFLTLFWIKKDDLEKVFFAYIFKEDNEMLEYYDEMSKQTGKEILADKQIRKKISTGKEYYIDLLDEAKTTNPFLKTKTKAGALFPSWTDIAGRIETLYKKKFFSTIKIGHKNYYRLVSLATHFRPSSVTANIPHFSHPEATSTSKILIVKITITLILILTEEITNRLAYSNKFKNAIKNTWG